MHVDAEVAEWLAKDPIPRLRDRLLSEGVDASLLDRVDAEARAEVDQAREEAKAARIYEPGGVERQVFADGGAQWRR